MEKGRLVSAGESQMTFSKCMTFPYIWVGSQSALEICTLVRVNNSNVKSHRGVLLFATCVAGNVAGAPEAYLLDNDRVSRRLPTNLAFAMDQRSSGNAAADCEASQRTSMDSDVFDWERGTPCQSAPSNQTAEPQPCGQAARPSYGAAIQGGSQAGTSGASVTTGSLSALSNALRTGTSTNSHPNSSQLAHSSSDGRGTGQEPNKASTSGHSDPGAAADSGGGESRSGPTQQQVAAMQSDIGKHLQRLATGSSSYKPSRFSTEAGVFVQPIAHGSMPRSTSATFISESFHSSNQSNQGLQQAAGAPATTPTSGLSKSKSCGAIAGAANAAAAPLASTPGFKAPATPATAQPLEKESGRPPAGPGASQARKPPIGAQAPPAKLPSGGCFLSMITALSIQLAISVAARCLPFFWAV